MAAAFAIRRINAFFSTIWPKFWTRWYRLTLSLWQPRFIFTACTVPRYEEIAGKDFYFIVAAADSNRANMEKTLETFRGFTEDCLPDAHEKGVIYGTGAWQIGDIKSSPAMEEAYQAGRNA